MLIYIFYFSDPTPHIGSQVWQECFLGVLAYALKRMYTSMDFDSSYDLCLLGSLILSCTCHSQYSQNQGAEPRARNRGTDTATSQASCAVTLYLPAVRKKLCSSCLGQSAVVGLAWACGLFTCLLFDFFSFCKHRCVLTCKTAAQRTSRNEKQFLFSH